MAALIMYGYFKNISKEYSEAAFIDGATVMQTFLFVVMPQAVPCVIALYVSNVMGNWNNYSTPMINLPKYPNLALGIYEIDRSSSFLGANGLAKKYGATVQSLRIFMFYLPSPTYPVSSIIYCPSSDRIQSSSFFTLGLSFPAQVTAYTGATTG